MKIFKEIEKFLITFKRKNISTDHNFRNLTLRPDEMKFAKSRVGCNNIANVVPKFVVSTKWILILITETIIIITIKRFKKKNFNLFIVITVLDLFSIPRF